MNIYVSNLSPETTGDELKQAFTLYGKSNTLLLCVTNPRADMKLDGTATLR